MVVTVGQCFWYLSIIRLSVSLVQNPLCSRGLVSVCRFFEDIIIPGLFWLLRDCPNPLWPLTSLLCCVRLQDYDLLESSSSKTSRFSCLYVWVLSLHQCAEGETKIWKLWKSMSGALGSWSIQGSQYFQTGIKQNTTTPQLSGSYHSLHSSQIYLEN